MARRRQWFYFRGGTAHGPFSSGEMRDLARSGALLESDLLWRPGMDRQRPAGQSTSLWADDDADSDGDAAAPGPRSTRTWMGAALVGVAIVLSTLLVVAGLSHQHSRATAVVPPRDGPAPVAASTAAAPPQAPDVADIPGVPGGGRPVGAAEGPDDEARAAARAAEDAADPPVPAPAPARAAGDDF